MLFSNITDLPFDLTEKPALSSGEIFKFLLISQIKRYYVIYGKYLGEEVSSFVRTFLWKWQENSNYAC